MNGYSRYEHTENRGPRRALIRLRRAFLPVLLSALLILALAGCSDRPQDGGSEASSDLPSQSSAPPQSSSSPEDHASSQDPSSQSSGPESSGPESSGTQIPDGESSGSGEPSQSEPESSAEESSAAPDPYDFLPQGFFINELDPDRSDDRDLNELDFSHSEDTLYLRLIANANTGIRYVCDSVSLPLEQIREGEPIVFVNEYDETIEVTVGSGALDIVFNDTPDGDWRSGHYVPLEPEPLSYPRPTVVHDPNSPDGAMDAGIAASARETLGLKKDAVLTVEDCAEITRLSVAPRETPVASLDGIGYFVNLKELSLWDSSIGDLSAIGSLGELESLSIVNGVAETLPDLSGCTKLRNIMISSVPLAGLEPLAAAPGLEYVTLVHTDIRSIAPLKDSHSIKSLVIDASCITDWESIGENEDLKQALMYDYEEYLEIEERAKEIVRETVTDGMSDLEKEVRLAKYVEDYITYSYEYEKSDEPHSLLYNGIIGHLGICHNYADAARYLMTSAGLKVIKCSSAGHEWNMICLDGKWYEFDCTWDDGTAAGEWVWFNRARSYMLGTDSHELVFPEMYPLAGENMPYALYAPFAEALGS